MEGGEGEMYVQQGGEVRITTIPGLRIGSQKDLTKSDSSVKVSPSGVKGSRKEDIRANAPYQPSIDDRGTKLAERLVRLNQKPPPPKVSPIPALPNKDQESVKTMGTLIILGSLFLGIYLGRWSTKINFSIGE